MSDQASDESLTATRDVAVVLRVVVDATGNVRYGEVIHPAGGRDRRFVGLDGVRGAIRDALADWIRDDVNGRDRRSETASNRKGQE